MGQSIAHSDPAPLTAPADRGRVALTVARFVLKHLAFLLLTLLVVSFLVFTLNEYSPGDVARKILGAYATQEQVEILTVQMGLDRPVLVRYVEFLGKIASGDLGNSTRFKVPVVDIIWTRLANPPSSASQPSQTRPAASP